MGIILKRITGNSRSIISSGLMYSVPLSSCFGGLITQLNYSDVHAHNSVDFIELKQ